MASEAAAVVVVVGVVETAVLGGEDVVGDGAGGGCGRAGRAFWRRGWIQVVVRVV